MPSNKRPTSASTAEEIVRGPSTVRQRRSTPRCLKPTKGGEARGLLDPYAGASQLTVPAYTDQVASLLRRIFIGDGQVVAEWRAMLGEEIRSPRTRRRVMYSPEVDLAVGPFAVLQGYIEEYDRLAYLHAELLEAMRRAFQLNLRNFGSSFKPPRLDGLCSVNLNARCFMALEIERGNTDVKYLIGSMINAASLGRVGLMVAWECARLGDLLRARETMALWGEVGKNTLNTGNLLFLTRGQVTRILTRFATNPPYQTWRRA